MQVSFFAPAAYVNHDLKQLHVVAFAGLIGIDLVSAEKE